MTRPNLSIDNNTEPEDTALELAAPDDSEPNNQVVSNVATANQPTAATSSARPSLLDFPPEIRVMIYRHVLRMPSDIRYNDLHHWIYPRRHTLHAVIAITFTSRLIRGESMPIFFQENTIFFSPDFSRLSVVPSPRVSDMMQNFSLTTAVHRPGPHPRLRARFAESIRILENAAILRGTCSVCFDIHGARVSDLDFLEFCLYLMRGLTNFRIVGVILRYRVSPTRHAADMHDDLVQNALRSVLGPSTAIINPASSSEIRRSVMFHPRAFVNARSSQYRVDENGGETNAD